ncbi:hypothetical protein XENTR_v10020883 [Xenopus tropicalis]|nr:hypothetical protein XENTR_v10020883 [Xenopus tropicalis]
MSVSGSFPENDKQLLKKVSLCRVYFAFPCQSMCVCPYPGESVILFWFHGCLVYMIKYLLLHWYEQVLKHFLINYTLFHSSVLLYGHRTNPNTNSLVVSYYSLFYKGSDWHEFLLFPRQKKDCHQHESDRYQGHQSVFSSYCAAVTVGKRE